MEVLKRYALADRAEGKPRQTIGLENTDLRSAFESMSEDEMLDYAGRPVQYILAEQRGYRRSWFRYRFWRSKIGSTMKVEIVHCPT